MAELMVASFGRNHWLLCDYGKDDVNNIQPLVFVADSTDGTHAAPFSVKDYERFCSNGKVAEFGKYYPITSKKLPLANADGKKAVVYTAESMARAFAKTIYERMVMHPNDRSVLDWSVSGDSSLFYKNEARVEFFKTETKEFVVGIDVYIFNPCLENMPSVVFGRRDVAYDPTDFLTWGSSETYKDLWLEREKLLSDVCRSIYDAVEDDLRVLRTRCMMPAACVVKQIPESEWNREYAPIKPYGVGPSGEILDVTMTDEEEGKLRRSLSLATIFAFEADNPLDSVELRVDGQDDTFAQKLCIILADLGFYNRFNRDRMTITVSPYEIAPF